MRGHLFLKRLQRYRGEREDLIKALKQKIEELEISTTKKREISRPT